MKEDPPSLRESPRPPAPASLEESELRFRALVENAFDAINLLGGELEVESELGTGSTFRVALLAVPPGEAAPDPSRQPVK